MLTGRPPFDGEGSGELIAAHLREAAAARERRACPACRRLSTRSSSAACEDPPRSASSRWPRSSQALGQAEQAALRSSQPTMAVDSRSSLPVAHADRPDAGLTPAPTPTPMPGPAPTPMPGWTPTPHPQSRATPVPWLTQRPTPNPIPLLTQPPQPAHHTTLSGANGQVGGRAGARRMIAGVAMPARWRSAASSSRLSHRHGCDKDDNRPPPRCRDYLPVPRLRAGAAPRSRSPGQDHAPVRRRRARCTCRVSPPVSPLRYATEIAPIDVVELVEVSANGHKTERYWITFDRATHLRAHLARARDKEATEEQTLVALGKAAAPAPAPVAAPAAKTADKTADKTPDKATDAHPAVAVAPTPKPTPRRSARPSRRARSRGGPRAAPTRTAPGGRARARKPPGARARAPHVAVRAMCAVRARGSSSRPRPTWKCRRMSRRRCGATTRSPPRRPMKVCVGPSRRGDRGVTPQVIGLSGLRQEAVAAIRTWRYKPYIVDGHGVPVCSAVTESLALK